MASRLILREWMITQARVPEDKSQSSPSEENPSAKARSDRIRQAVRAALARLPDRERKLIEQYYFIGTALPEIAEKSGRDLHRLDSLLNRAVRQLRKELTPMVRKLFGPEAVVAEKKRFRPKPYRGYSCAICSSIFREDIDRLIAARDRTATWRPVIAAIRKRYGVVIRSPQAIIGHERYHARQ